MKSLGEFKQQLQDSVLSSHIQLNALTKTGVMSQTECAHLESVIQKMSGNELLTPQESQLVYEAFKGINKFLTTFEQTITNTQQSVLESSDLSAVSMYHEEPPPLVVLRRKAIRMYPFNTRVALYYSDKLNRYFSVPYRTSKDI